MRTLLLLLGGAAILQPFTFCLRIGAFNIQTFGDKKLSNQTISNLIVRILSTYDLILIQEVRDADLSAVKNLMNQLNWASPDPYSYVVSKPLGRSSYKEQYLFVYRDTLALLLLGTDKNILFLLERQDSISLVDSYYYDDGCEPCGNDIFSREPFVVKFAASQTVAKELILVPLHAAPGDAVAEIDALYDVYLDVRDKWGSKDVLFLGDFNADCTYVWPEDWPFIRLRSSSAFQWLIPDTADTTTTSTHCAYDRIVVAGARLRDGILPGTAKVDNFQKNFRLSPKDVNGVNEFPLLLPWHSKGVHGSRSPSGLGCQ